MSGLRISTTGLGMGVEIDVEVSQGRDWKGVDYKNYVEQGMPALQCVRLCSCIDCQS